MPTGSAQNIKSILILIFYGRMFSSFSLIFGTFQWDYANEIIQVGIETRMTSCQSDILPSHQSQR